MQAPGVESVLTDFFERLREAAERALLLDYDGTLAPFRIKPEDAVPYPGVRPVLDAIMEDTRTRAVMISGRPAEDLIPLLGLKQVPEIWGSHGWERRTPDGRHTAIQPNRAACKALAEAEAWIGEIEALGGRCELKPGCFTVHWRGLDDDRIDRVRSVFSKKASALVNEGGVVLRDFDGGMELRAPGRNKGHVVETILDEMDVHAVAAYLGDDLTDEDAFKAIRGRGLGILVREESRPTAAEIRLEPPGELLEFLARWKDACGGTR